MQHMSELASDVSAHEEPVEFARSDQFVHARDIGGTVLRVLGAGAGLAVAGAAAATFLFPTQAHIGGAEASINLQFGTSTSIDPGGSALLSLETPLHLGPISAHVTIDKFGFGLTPGSNDAVIQQYAQSFSDQRQDISNVEHALELQAVAGAGAAEALAIGLVLSTALIKRQINKHSPTFESQLTEPSMALYHRRVQLLFAGLGIAGIAGAATAQYVNHNEAIKPSAVFAGTFLEGSELSGLSAPLLMNYGPKLIDGIEASDHYYDQLNNNFQAVFKAQFKNIKPAEGQFNVLTISDRHCNFGMNRFIRSVAHDYGVVLILDAGDDAAGATDLESPCVTTLTDSIKSIPIVESPGNHDPKTKAGDAIKTRMIVLEGGKPVTVHVAGTDLRIVGAADPRTSSFGQGIQPPTKIDQAAVLSIEADTVKESACDAAAHGEPASIVVAHDPKVVKRVLQAGCGVTFGLSGHTHIKTKPEAVTSTGTSYALTEGSTGGAGVNKNGITIAGPLLAKAEMSVITFDTATKVPIGYYTITANPDQTIELSEFIPFAVPPTHSVPPVQILTLPAKR